MAERQYYQVAGWLPYRGGKAFYNFGPEFETRQQAEEYYETLKTQSKLPENFGIAKCTWLDERVPRVEYTIGGGDER